MHCHRLQADAGRRWRRHWPRWHWSSTGGPIRDTCHALSTATASANITSPPICNGSRWRRITSALSTLAVRGTTIIAIAVGATCSWWRTKVVLSDLARRWHVVGVEPVFTRPTSGVAMDTFRVEDLLA